MNEDYNFNNHNDQYNLHSSNNLSDGPSDIYKAFGRHTAAGRMIYNIYKAREYNNFFIYYHHF